MKIYVIKYTDSQKRVWYYDGLGFTRNVSDRLFYDQKKAESIRDTLQREYENREKKITILKTLPVVDSSFKQLSLL